MEKKEKSKGNMIQSVERALSILECFSKRDNELGVTEIANALDLHKSTTFGLLATLESKGYVQQNLETGKYKLGFKLMQLGKMVEEDIDIRAKARPILKRLVNLYQETAHLALLINDEVVYIDKVEGEGAIRMYSQVGTRVKLYCTGVGKSVLAFLPEEKTNKIMKAIEFESFTEKTIKDIESLKKELARIRLNGYSTDDEEIEIGLKCVAAPIKNYNNEVVGAISVAGSTVRMCDEKYDEIVKAVKDAALDISVGLGFISKK